MFNRIFYWNWVWSRQSMAIGQWSKKIIIEATRNVIKTITAKKRNFRWRTNTLKQSHNPKTRKNVVLTVNVIERLFGLPFIVLCCSRCSSVLFIYSFFLSLSLCLFLSVYTISIHSFGAYVSVCRWCKQVID